jgi:hypothetical protein
MADPTIARIGLSGLQPSQPGKRCATNPARSIHLRPCGQRARNPSPEASARFGRRGWAAGRARPRRLSLLTDLWRSRSVLLSRDRLAPAEHQCQFWASGISMAASLRERMATHEASHATAALILGVPIVGIRMDPPHMHRGHYRAPHDCGLEYLVTICLSGLIGEELICGTITDGSDQADYENGEGVPVARYRRPAPSRHRTRPLSRSSRTSRAQRGARVYRVARWCGGRVDLRRCVCGAEIADSSAWIPYR